MNIFIVNGPNLNLLGIRETEKYGTKTLPQIEEEMRKYVENKNINLTFFQSNSEGEIIDFLQKNYTKIDFLIFNPGAFTHKSIAIRDTILGLNISFVEVHLTNIYKREDFRRISYFSDISEGVISGFGWYGYMLALKFVEFKLK